MIESLFVGFVLVVCLGMIGFICTRVIQTRIDASLTETIRWLEKRKDTFLKEV